jgi:uncharacterized protein
VTDASNGMHPNVPMDPEGEALQALVRRIVSEVHPLKIILFGSAARRTAGPQSDLDLLVVMPDGTHRRHTAKRLYRNLTGISAPL